MYELISGYASNGDKEILMILLLSLAPL